GETHPDVAASLNNLAGLYHDQGNYNAAEPLYRRSLEIRETALGESHPDVAQSLNNLAGLYHDQGNYNAAEPLYRRSLEIWETALGESHPSVAQTLNNLAGFYQAQGDTSQSLSFLQRGLEIEETNLAQNLAIGSEARKQAYIATLFSTTHATVSLHLQDAPDHPEAARLALTTVLRRKGRILDAVTETQQLLRDNLGPELAPLLDDYTNAQTQLATRLYAGLGNQDLELYRSEIDTLRQQVDQLENDLSRRSAEFRVATEPVEIEAVQALIPDDAALVELVQYSPLDYTSFNWGTPRYAAYVLHSSGEPQWVDLGDAETIDNAAFAFLNATRSPNPQQWAQTTGRQLDELLMAPIRPLLGDATHLLLSPDGQLNLIPFAALVDEENRYLVESYQLTHLTTGRDLLRLQYPRPSRQPPVLFANPDYDDADTSAVAQVARATRGESQRSMEIEELRFGELPGTQREVEAIAPLMDNPIILTEAEATENALKQVQAPSILHLATHGFFLQDVEFVPPHPTPYDSRGDILVVTGAQPGQFFAPPSDRPTSSENPLLRSGLAFAGFNTRDSEGEDGVLTALEAVGLDLRGTRLVVMSACETGVGDVANGEGVYGLRRALVMAGAESQLMSLWKVADEETAQLMRDYYQRLLAREGRSEALREVQLDWLEQGKHPYYWASFLFSGQWTPMDDFTEM
ncbi:MAG: CHAT domain-containing protein, partial [Phormidium sp.]